MQQSNLFYRLKIIHILVIETVESVLPIDNNPDLTVSINKNCIMIETVKTVLMIDDNADFTAWNSQICFTNWWLTAFSDGNSKICFTNYR